VSTAAATCSSTPTRPALPEDFALPPGGLNIRWPDPPLNQEMRLHQYAVLAATAFARANKIDKVVIDSPNAQLGIVTTGKSYLDVLQALEYLGLSESDAREIGICVYKIGMAWRLEPVGIREFARGLEDSIVVEGKRCSIESQMKERMYNWPEQRRPHIVGKYDEAGNGILPSTNELTPAMITLVIAKRLSRFFDDRRRQCRAGRRNRQRARAHPRLRPRQARASDPGQATRDGAVGTVAAPDCRAGGGLIDATASVRGVGCRRQRAARRLLRVRAGVQIHDQLW
jgi:TPP-dependent indolepyruvate ferredoxin oxidoreductase alpha subunit